MRVNTITQTTLQEISNPQIEFSVEDIHIKLGIRCMSDGCPVFLSMMDKIRELGIHGWVSVTGDHISVMGMQGCRNIPTPKAAMDFVIWFDTQGPAKVKPFKFTLPMALFQ